MPEFDALPCWEIPVGHTVASDVGSLSADEDPVFFATHVELPIHQQKGGSGLRESADVLTEFQSELDSNPHQNTVVAVTGPSGSGKSHLVRWIQAKLSLAEGDLLVYVPRHVTTLRETLQLVCGQIGGEIAAQVLDQLEAAVGSVSEAQLSGQLIDAICQVLEHEPSTAGIASANTILPVGDHSRRGLPSIMRLERVRDYLLREDLTMRELAASILGRNVGGDQERPQFEEYDLDFLEMDGLDGALDHQSSHARKLLASRHELRSDAVELINRSVDAAVQRTLGWRDGPSLRTVFTDVRERLAGRQLVLLFEDLALVNFVEGAILDEFANHGSATRAPLRVMFAVTDDKYTALAETIEGRVTSHFRVGALPLGEEDAGELALREEFIARHLNLARVGRGKVLEEARAGRPLPVKCGDCRSQDECFNGFGSVPIDVGGQTEEVGLFPYNRVALRRAFRSLDIDRRRDSRRVTARAAIDRIIIRGLDVAHDALTSGSMPNAAVASIVDDDSFAQTRDDVLTGATGLDESMQDRIYRTRVFWMDERLETYEVAKAFGLPDMGDVGQRPDPVVPPVPPPPPSPVTGSAPAFVQEVLRWVNSDNDDETLDAEADEDVRTLLEKLVTARIDLRPYLIASGEAEARRLLGVLLGRNSFSLGGTGRPQKGRLRFDLPRTSTTYRLVVGAAWLDKNKDWDFGSEKASWPLPRLSENWSLPVEVESFLSECAATIEGAVVASIIEGPDPASVAYCLRSRAAAALVDDPPVKWRPVVQAAEKVCADEGIKSAVLSFAGAVGPSSRADVAALDVARLDIQDNVKGDVARLKERFPYLVESSAKFDRAADSALPALVEQTKEAVKLLADNVGDTSLEQAARSVVSAGQAANQAGFFRPEDRYAAFLEACRRLADVRVPPSGIADRLMESPLDPHVIEDAAHLLAVARDVELLMECCEAMARAGQERVTAEAGGVDARSEEDKLAKAGEDFVAALWELAEEANR